MEENEQKGDILISPTDAKESQSKPEECRKHVDLNAIVEQRRDKIKELIEKIGLWNMNTKLLAEQFKVSQRTIERDVNWIKGHYKPENMMDIKIQMHIALKKALNEAFLALATSKDNETKIKASQALFKATESYRQELEAWGEKEKIPNKYEIEQKSIKISKEIKEYSVIFEKLTPEEQRKMREVLIKEVENEGEST